MDPTGLHTSLVSETAEPITAASRPVVVLTRTVRGGHPRYVAMAIHAASRYRLISVVSLIYIHTAEPPSFLK